MSDERWDQDDKDKEPERKLAQDENGNYYYVDNKD